MNRYCLLLAVAGTAFIVGCASADKKAEGPDDDKDFVTGSRLPVKTGTGHAAATTSRQGIDDMLRNRNVGTSPPQN